MMLASNCGHNWSRADADFAHEWERSNPCEPIWKSMKPGGRIGLGTLIYEADLVDPKRTRFTSNNKQILEAAESPMWCSCSATPF